MRDSTPVLFLALQRLKFHHPELIESATESALAKSRQEAAQLEEAAVTARKAADDAKAGVQKLQHLLGSGASPPVRGITSVKKGGIAAAFAAQATAKKTQKRPRKPAARASSDAEDEEYDEEYVKSLKPEVQKSLGPRRKTAGRAAAKKAKYAEVDDDDSGSDFEEVSAS